MENFGEGSFSFPQYRESEESMVTVSDIIMDVQRGIMAHNMVENMFSYRIVYFVNENDKGTKFYVDTLYGGLRTALENIIRGNLTTANTVVISAITALKDGKCVSLLSRAYGFNLNEYFQRICEAKEKEYISNNYGRRKANWCQGIFQG